MMQNQIGDLDVVALYGDFERGLYPGVEGA
jgi:hypothetical protein